MLDGLMTLLLLLWTMVPLEDIPTGTDTMLLDSFLKLKSHG
jgi:hypothetical protein